jgi:hypothetical protein
MGLIGTSPDCRHAHAHLNPRRDSDFPLTTSQLAIDRLRTVNDIVQGSTLPNNSPEGDRRGYPRRCAQRVQVAGSKGPIKALRR